jgi:predicted DNA-binding transcriptional regulator AlpA
MKSQEQRFSGKVLRAKDAASFLSIGESTFWRWVQQDRLPKGVRLSARVTIWRTSDLEAFIEQQFANQGAVS